MYSRCIIKVAVFWAVYHLYSGRLSNEEVMFSDPCSASEIHASGKAGTGLLSL